MAYLLTAHCPLCGYQKNGLIFGSGMMRPVPLIPAIKMYTHDAFSVEPGLEDQYGYYHHRDMYAHDIEGAGIETDGIRLNPKGNMCPLCWEFGLEFTVTGNID